MKDGPFVVQRLARFSQSLFASAKTAEILGRLGDEVSVELHGDATRGLSTNRDIEKDPRAGFGVGFGGHCVFYWGDS